MKFFAIPAVLAALSIGVWHSFGDQDDRFPSVGDLELRPISLEVIETGKAPSRRELWVEQR